MRARTLLPGLGLSLAFVASLSGGLVAAGPPPTTNPKPAVEPVDISGIRAQLKLFTDGKGHYIATVTGDDRRMFYSPDGAQFAEQLVIGYSEDGSQHSFSFSFWEPRANDGWQKSFDVDRRGFKLQCEDRQTQLTAVTPADTQALLAKASFVAPIWKWSAFALARDDRGNYYYVDRARFPEDNRNFRLWIGPVGAMKPQQMKNVVSDSEGTIFSTPKGQLRLILSANDAAWVKGRKRTALKIVPAEDNLRLIYRDLGVYSGLPLGTPCDDL